MDASGELKFQSSLSTMACIAVDDTGHNRHIPVLPKSLARELPSLARFPAVEIRQAPTDRSLPGFAAHAVIPASALSPPLATRTLAGSMRIGRYMPGMHIHSAQGTSSFVHKPYAIDQPPWDRCEEPSGIKCLLCLFSLKYLPALRDF